MTSPDTLHVALSDSLVYPRLTALLTLHRQHEPGVRVRLREASATELSQGLEDGTFDVGLSQSAPDSRGLSATPIWRDALMMGVARRHPLLAHRSIPLELIASCAWITLDAHAGAGYRAQIERLLAAAGVSPSSTIEVKSFDLMMTLVAAGYGVCLAPAARVESYHPLGVVGRPLAHEPAEITTYLLRSKSASSASADRLAERARGIGA